MTVVTDTPAAGSAESAAEERDSLYSWLVVAFLMVLYTSSFIDRTILNLLVKPIRADLHITDSEFSYLTGLAFVVLYTIAGIPLGWMADRWSRRGLIAAGVALWSIMTASCGLANSFWRLFVSRVGVGIGEATLSPCSYSLISEYFPPRRLARPLSVFALGIPIGSGLALMIGGSVIEAIAAIGPIELPMVGVTQPWQSVFLMVGLPGLILALLTVLIIRDRRQPSSRVVEEQPNFAAVFSYMWGHRKVYGTIALSLGSFAAFSYGANAWFPTYLLRVHGFTAGEAGLFLGGSTLVFGVIGSVTAGWFADRLAQRGRLDGLSVVGIAYAVGLFVCGALGPIVREPRLSLVLLSLAGFFSLTWVGVNTSILQIVTPKRMRAQVSAIHLFFTNMIGLGLGPTAVAASTDYIFKRDQAVGSSLALVGTVALAVGCLILWLGRRTIARRLVECGARAHVATVRLE